MNQRARLGILALAVGAFGAGCDGGEGGGGAAEGSRLLETLPAVSVDTTGKLLAFSQASAPNVFYQSYLPILTADLAGQFGGTCPSKATDGAKTVYEGGCTADGTEWIGTATVTQSGTESEIRYDGFGFLSTTSCGNASHATASEWNGKMTVGGLSPSSSGGAFEVDLRLDLEDPDDGCVTTVSAMGVVYSGSFDPNGPDGDGDGEPDAQIFEGSGELGIEMISGGDPGAEGKVAAQTADEVVVTTFAASTSFTLCQTEALSGQTTIEGDSHTTEILYDGDTDCDESSTVMWRLDGADRGEASGIGCSVAATSSPAFYGTALLGLLALFARRRGSSRTK